MRSTSAGRLGLALTLIVMLVGGLGAGAFVLAQEPDGQEQARETVNTQSTAALQNGGFDNERWYEFNGRYGHYLEGSWVPDDDDGQHQQDWRLWFLDGRDILEFDPTSDKHAGAEAVVARIYDQENVRSQLGGIYQTVYNTVPCLEYNFEIYAKAVTPGNDDRLYALQVGIDRVGTALPTDDPAVHDSFPSTTVWGQTQKYENAYGQLSVTAEALADKISVWTYADVVGQRSAQVFWDTASLEEIVPSTLYDAENHSATGGISSLTFNSGNQVVSWNTGSNSSIGQVFYRTKAGPGGTPTEPLTYTIYLPLVTSYRSWSATPVDTTYGTSHLIVLSDLKSGYTYEYFAVSRGVSGDQCTNWVSEVQEFTAP